MQNRDMALDYVKIGHRVKVSRKGENLSQEALAEKCATTSRYLSDIENGKCKPSLDMLAKICVALDVSIDKPDDETRNDGPSPSLPRDFGLVSECRVFSFKEKWGY